MFGRGDSRPGTQGADVRACWVRGRCVLGGLTATLGGPASTGGCAETGAERQGPRGPEGPPLSFPCTGSCTRHTTRTERGTRTHGHCSGLRQARARARDGAGRRPRPEPGSHWCGARVGEEVRGSDDGTGGLGGVSRPAIRRKPFDYNKTLKELTGKNGLVSETFEAIFLPCGREAAGPLGVPSGGVPVPGVSCGGQLPAPRGSPLPRSVAGAAGSEAGGRRAQRQAPGRLRAHEGPVLRGQPRPHRALPGPERCTRTQPRPGRSACRPLRGAALGAARPDPPASLPPAGAPLHPRSRRGTPGCPGLIPCVWP